MTINDISERSNFRDHAENFATAGAVTFEERQKNMTTEERKYTAKRIAKTDPFKDRIFKGIKEEN